MSPLQLFAGIHLRLVRTPDGAGLVDAYVRNREHLAPWEPARPDEYFTLEWQCADISKQIEGYTEGICLPLVIATATEVIGRVTLSSIVHGPLESAILGYWLDERFTGRGVISAAVAGVIEVARDQLGLHRLEAGTLPHNRASQKVLRTAGFECFGTAKKYLKIAGEWQDHRLFQRILHD